MDLPYHLENANVFHSLLVLLNHSQQLPYWSISLLHQVPVVSLGSSNLGPLHLNLPSSRANMHNTASSCRGIPISSI